MVSSNELYAVVVLDENDYRPERLYELCISLSLTFMLSKHIRFSFPMSNQVSRIVDRAFDRVLKGLPMASKGITYEKDLSGYEMDRLLEMAHFVVTSDKCVHQKMNARSGPNLLIVFQRDRSPLIRPRFLENLGDDDLNWQIINCVQLVNVVTRIRNIREDLRERPGVILNGFRELHGAEYEIKPLHKSSVPILAFEK
jgi:hypothetical protein